MSKKLAMVMAYWMLLIADLQVYVPGFNDPEAPFCKKKLRIHRSRDRRLFSSCFFLGSGRSPECSVQVHASISPRMKLLDVFPKDVSRSFI